MQCVKCKSEDLIKLSLVHSAGLSEIDTRTRGHGLTFGDNGLVVGTGNFTTTGTSQTRLSKVASPPRKKPYRVVLLGWFLGILIVGCILGYVTTITHGAEARFEQQFRWFAYGYSCLAALALAVLWRYNHRIYPQRFQHWNRSLICRRCGEIFRPQAREQKP